jgi:hypothetical protein
MGDEPEVTHDPLKDKIIFVPYRHGYYIKYIDTKGNPKFLGKIRQDLLQTAMWFYRLEDIPMEIGEYDASISS